MQRFRVERFKVKKRKELNPSFTTKSFQIVFGDSRQVYRFLDTIEKIIQPQANF